MKKYITLIILSLLAITIHAQTEHAKFMGIPINGTITQFQQKLQAKGIQYDAVGSRSIRLGTRIFKGVFGGEKAQFHVNYVHKSQIVYYVGVVIDCLSKEDAENKLQKFKSNLDDKYPFFDKDEEDRYWYLIPSKNYEEAIGDIGIWYDYDSENYYYPYTLFVKYTDYYNSKLNDKSISDDF